LGLFQRDGCLGNLAVIPEFCETKYQESRVFYEIPDISFRNSGMTHQVVILNQFPAISLLLSRKAMAGRKNPVLSAAQPRYNHL